MKPVSSTSSGVSLFPRRLSHESESVLKTGNPGFCPAWRSVAPRWPLLRSAFFILFAGSAGFGFAQESTLPPAPKSPIDQAEKLLNEGKPREALSLLSEIAEKDPKAPGLEGKLGKAYFQLRQFPQAAAHLKIALK